MRLPHLAGCLLFSGLCASSAAADDVACSAAKHNEVRERASATRPHVYVNCNLTLSSTDVITKTIRVNGSDASDLTVNCNGARIDGTGSVNEDAAMIRISSRMVTRADGSCVKDATGNYCSYEAPENVTFRDCKIKGRTNISGMGGVPDVTRHADYTEKVRAYGPKNIRFENVTVTADNDIAFYVYPGVSGFQLLSSSVSGVSDSVAIYLDAESLRHTIKNSSITVNTARELIAVDGSSYNRILNNYFSYTSDGGIYLYRNCGEAPGDLPQTRGNGSIRHSVPRNNVIINNRFSNGDYDGSNPNIFLGSRNGNRNYCDADLDKDGNAYPWGSSASNLDYARYNVVMQNQIFNAPFNDMIRVGRPSTDSHNAIDHNETVSASIYRKAGCYLSTGFNTNFLLDGQSASVVRDANGVATCVTQRCTDGDLTDTGSCTMHTTSFSCQASSNNDGCNTSKACPVVSSRQTTIVGAKAGCNLEYGTVSSAQLAAITPGKLEVVRESDDASDGSCYAGNTSISTSYAAIRGAANQSRLNFGCEEHDENGGDCHITGTLYCR